MSKPQQNTAIIHRITLAWAISECALGGFMHALNSPFTGLIVGGLSVLFISLIAFHATKPVSALVQSMVFVLGVKMAVSPHSPVAAYFAVAFQAFMGMVLFTLFSRFKVAAICLGFFSLVGSAVQKVFILTVLFGMGFWNAIDKFVQEMGGKLNFISIQTDFSITEWLVGSYLIVYAVGGVLIGLLAAKIPSIFHAKSEEFNTLISGFKPNGSEADRPTRKFKLWPLVLVFIALGIGLQWILFSAETAMHQLMRTGGVLLAWVCILRPLFTWILKRSLRKSQASLQYELEEVQLRIPQLVEFAQYAWKNRKQLDSSSLFGFLSVYVYYAIYKL